MEGCGYPRGDGTTLWAGWPFYFVRKYLAQTSRRLGRLDDPMRGYADSVEGNYVTPGEATRSGKLIMYDLNRAELGSRGRLVMVPGVAANYPEGIVLHKALVGDPRDHENYPGSILVNCPILKVHCLSVITNAIKNIGIGGWPMRAGRTSDPADHDWLYAFPHEDPPGIKAGVPGGADKGGVYHCKWFVKKVNDEGMPLEIAKRPNRGIDGTMVDINLAIRSQVPVTLHVTDAIRTVNLEHGGRGIGVGVDEGFVFASVDPVAMDLLCARYFFATQPRDPASPSSFERLVPVPRFDPGPGTIVTGSRPDDRVALSRLFAYAASRGMGRVAYHVEGLDRWRRTRPRWCPGMATWGG